MENDKSIDTQSEFSPEELKFLNLIAEIIVNISIDEANEIRDTH